MIGIVFWNRVPYESESGAPTSAFAVAKRLGVPVAELEKVFKGWAHAGYPREYGHPTPGAEPEILYIWHAEGADMGWVRRGRTWGKTYRMLSGGTPFTMEIVI